MSGGFSRAVRRAAGALACMLALVCGACATGPAPRARQALPATTDGAIALANLDGLIEQAAGEAGGDELLLMRSRFLADYAVFDQLAALTETHAATPDELLRRARARAAVHRFADALADVEAAARLGASGASGASGEALATQRAALLVATGRAGEALPTLRAAAARRPGFAADAALANALAALGRLDEADALYARALANLDTAWPFPYAALQFARGLMWAEQGGDPARGEAHYRQALRHLPQYVAATIHLAELEAARGDTAAAQGRLARVAASDEPEALALIGELHARAGGEAQGHREIAVAAQRYDALLQRHPLAFGDHAAEFYLGPGADPERAHALAQANLAARPTRRAYQLAVQAAWKSGRVGDARALEARLQARVCADFVAWRADGTGEVGEAAACADQAL